MLLVTCCLIVLVFVLFCCVLLLVCFDYIKKHFNYWKNYPQIPTVKGRMFSGNLWKFITFKTNFIFQLKTIYEDPKFRNEAAVGIYALEPALLIRDPELIKSVFIRDFDCFRSRHSYTNMKHDSLFAKMLFFAKYNVWKDVRSKLSNIFTTGKLRQMYPLITQVGENVEEHLFNKGKSFICEMKHLASLYTTDVIATTVFGISSNSLKDSSEKMYVQTNLLTHFNLKRGFDFLVISFAPKLTKFFNVKGMFPETEIFLRETTEYMINDREQSGNKRNDMIDIFVKLKEAAQANGENMQEFMELMSAQTGIFLAGGFDTSSTAISNTFLLLAKHRDVQQRLRQEILKAFIDGEGSITYEALSELEYLNMVIDEVLRMYPIFPLLEREYTKPYPYAEDYSLKPYYDFNLPEGMTVYTSVLGLNYDPQYWTNPTQFDPERFSKENKQSINPNIYIPFGHGPRNCIGKRLAEIQLKICIIYTLRNHRVNLCALTNVEAKFNTKAIFLQPEGGIYLEVIRDDLCNSILSK